MDGRKVAAIQDSAVEACCSPTRAGRTRKEWRRENTGSAGEMYFPQTYSCIPHLESMCHDSSPVSLYRALPRPPVRLPGPRLGPPSRLETLWVPHWRPCVVRELPCRAKWHLHLPLLCRHILRRPIDDIIIEHLLICCPLSIEVPSVAMATVRQEVGYTQGTL